jgi:hypothetical protein
MHGSQSSGSPSGPSSGSRRTLELREYVEREVAAIAEFEHRPKAEVERLLLVKAFKAYRAGDGLQFRDASRPAPEVLADGEQPASVLEFRNGLRLLQQKVDEEKETA